MAHIGAYLFARHLRSEPTSHMLHYRGGRLVRSGRGIAYWFLPISASVAEIPCDDRDLTFLFHGRTSDFQDVTTQGVITYRVVDPARVAARVDFSIDVGRGTWLRKPLEQIGQMLSQLAQQFAWDYVSGRELREVLAEGMIAIGERVRAGFAAHAPLAEMGLQIVSVRVAGVAPTAELEKALQTPAREAIQQQADQATFERRALAVEKERAIQENELQNRIELAKREEQLIAQQGQNERSQAKEHAEARAIAAEGRAARDRLRAGATADGIRTVQQARVEAEKNRIDAYRDVPVGVLMGLAARRFAGKLERIEHLNLTPDLLAPVLAGLAEAAKARLATKVPAKEVK
jgi:regulator of protease activity HflC (stomatin/prohibitin superfamily)